MVTPTLHRLLKLADDLAQTTTHMPTTGLLVRDDETVDRGHPIIAWRRLLPTFFVVPHQEGDEARVPGSARTSRHLMLTSMDDTWVAVGRRDGASRPSSFSVSGPADIESVRWEVQIRPSDDHPLCIAQEVLIDEHSTIVTQLAVVSGASVAGQQAGDRALWSVDAWRYELDPVGTLLEVHRLTYEDPAESRQSGSASALFDGVNLSRQLGKRSIWKHVWDWRIGHIEASTPDQVPDGLQLAAAVVAQLHSRWPSETFDGLARCLLINIDPHPDTVGPGFVRAVVADNRSVVKAEPGSLPALHAARALANGWLPSAPMNFLLQAPPELLVALRQFFQACNALADEAQFEQLTSFTQALTTAADQLDWSQSHSAFAVLARDAGGSEEIRMGFDRMFDGSRRALGDTRVDAAIDMLVSDGES